MTGVEILAAVNEGPLNRYNDKGRWATTEEGQVLYDLVVRHSIKQAIEIGTANGWTACWMALAGAKVNTYDISARVKVYQDKAFPLPILADLINFKMIGSPDCVNDIQTIERPEGSVLFFIDGDHSYVGVSRDFEALKPLFKTGDLIVLHDTNEKTAGVRRFWRQLKRKYPGQFEDFLTFNGMGVLTWRC